MVVFAGAVVEPDPEPPQEVNKKTFVIEMHIKASSPLADFIKLAF
jgi:hypothetical protein